MQQRSERPVTDIAIYCWSLVVLCVWQKKKHKALAQTLSLLSVSWRYWRLSLFGNSNTSYTVYTVHSGVILPTHTSMVSAKVNKSSTVLIIYLSHFTLGSFIHHTVWSPRLWINWGLLRAWPSVTTNSAALRFTICPFSGWHVLVFSLTRSIWAHWNLVARRLFYSTLPGMWSGSGTKNCHWNSAK